MHLVFEWDHQKNEKLKRERGISFEELEQTAANTIEILRLGRRDLIEYFKEPTPPAAVMRSTTQPLHIWKQATRAHISPSLRKPAVAVA